MTLKVKKSLLVTLVLVLCATLFSFIYVNKAHAEEQITFEPGAYLRVDTFNQGADNTSGIRFVADIPEAYRDKEEIGIIIIPSFVVDEFNGQQEETDLFTFVETEYGNSKEKISNTISKAELVQNEGKLSGAIVKLKDSNYNFAYTAIAYYVDEGVTNYIQSEVSTTIAQIASMTSLAEVRDDEAFKQLVSGILEKSVKLEAGLEELELDVAIGKTIDLGKAFTDTIGTEVTWAITEGSENAVRLGDNLQVVDEGEIKLTATYGNVSLNIIINGQEAENPEDACDFVVEVEAGRDIRVLQITDTQMAPNLGWARGELDDLVYKYVRKAVTDVDPDFIILTGDNVWGNFDEEGEVFKAFVELIDSYNVPWALVYGNHDNESNKGATWQNEQIMNSKNGLFLRGVASGNGNYTVGIKQGGELKRVFVMLDTNQCGEAYDASNNNVKTSQGLADNQIEWFNRTLGAIRDKKNIPVSVAQHIPNYGFINANDAYATERNGLDTNYYTIGLDFASKNGDFGTFDNMNGTFGTVDDDKDAITAMYKENGVDSVFCGHSHEISTSILNNGIRWTFGLKTGKMDVTSNDNLGGTKITLSGKNISVEHAYYDPTYNTFRTQIAKGNYEERKIEGFAINGKDELLKISNTQLLGVTKDVIGGELAYHIETVRNNLSTDPGAIADIAFDSSLIGTGKSLSFSCYIPSQTIRGIYGLAAFFVERGGCSSLYAMKEKNKNFANANNVYFAFDTWQRFEFLLDDDGKVCKSLKLCFSQDLSIYVKDIKIEDATTSGELLYIAKDSGYLIKGTGSYKQNPFFYGDAPQKLYLQIASYDATLELKNVMVDEYIAKGFRQINIGYITPANATMTPKIPENSGITSKGWGTAETEKIGTILIPEGYEFGEGTPLSLYMANVPDKYCYLTSIKFTRPEEVEAPTATVNVTINASTADNTEYLAAVEKYISDNAPYYMGSKIDITSEIESKKPANYAIDNDNSVLTAIVTGGNVTFTVALIEPLAEVASTVSVTVDGKASDNTAYVTAVEEYISGLGALFNGGTIDISSAIASVIPKGYVPSDTSVLSATITGGEVEFVIALEKITSSGNLINSKVDSSGLITKLYGDGFSKFSLNSNNKFEMTFSGGNWSDVAVLSNEIINQYVDIGLRQINVTYSTTGNTEFKPSISSGISSKIIIENWDMLTTPNVEKTAIIIIEKDLVLGNDDYIRIGSFNAGQSVYISSLTFTIPTTTGNIVLSALGNKLITQTDGTLKQNLFYYGTPQKIYAQIASYSLELTIDKDIVNGYVAEGLRQINILYNADNMSCSITVPANSGILKQSNSTKATILIPENYEITGDDKLCISLSNVADKTFTISSISFTVPTLDEIDLLLGGYYTFFEAKVFDGNSINRDTSDDSVVINEQGGWNRNSGLFFIDEQLQALIDAGYTHLTVDFAKTGGSVSDANNIAYFDVGCVIDGGFVKLGTKTTDANDSTKATIEVDLTADYVGKELRLVQYYPGAKTTVYKVIASKPAK